MTSSKKKHHPQPASTPRPTPKPTQRPVADPAGFTATRKQWIIRGVAVLGMIVGLGMVLVGVTPGIAGGWGKLLLLVPGAVIIAGSFAAFVETTSNARSLRRRQ
jgi:uncharacterized membrane protein YedE/YeeE